MASASNLYLNGIVTRELEINPKFIDHVLFCLFITCAEVELSLATYWADNCMHLTIRWCWLQIRVGTAINIKRDAMYIML